MLVFDGFQEKKRIKRKKRKPNHVTAVRMAII